MVSTMGLNFLILISFLSITQPHIPNGFAELRAFLVSNYKSDGKIK